MNWPVRLNKYLAEAGVCSRREADRRIERGEVTIDGVVADIGQKVYAGQKVCIGETRVVPEEEDILLLFHKPRGIVCTAEKREKNNVIDYIGYPKRIYPIGRLDKDSRGLLLLTNRGDIAGKIMRAKNHHEKEYHVTIDRPVTDVFLRRMREGVYLEELSVTTRRCQAYRLSETAFGIILTQGMNRQIRRMSAACGARVIDLERVRVMNFTLDDLKEGAYRPATKQEWQILYDTLAYDEE